MDPVESKIKALFGEPSSETRRDYPHPHFIAALHEIAHEQGQRENELIAIRHMADHPSARDGWLNMRPIFWGTMQPSILTRESNPMRTKLQTIAEQVAARAYGVPLEDIQAIVDNPDSDERLVGFVGMDWVSLIMQIMQIVMDMMGDCQFGSRLLKSVRQPNMFARVILRHRVARVFRNGNPAFATAGSVIAEALEEETKQLSDDVISDALVEIKRPDRYIIV